MFKSVTESATLVGDPASLDQVEQYLAYPAFKVTGATPLPTPVLPPREWLKLWQTGTPLFVSMSRPAAHTLRVRYMSPRHPGFRLVPLLISSFGLTLLADARETCTEDSYIL